jgi:type VI secretion system protein ImpL
VSTPTAPVEAKSYFLHDLFMNIIFPDGNIAARSALEEKRELFMKVLVAGATFALAVILAVPAFSSYLNNKEFLEESERRSKETAQISWGDTGTNLSRKLQQLGPTREHLLEHWRLEEDGVPLKLSFWMYVADRTYRPKVLVYATQMNAGFVLPCKARLEEQLKTASGDKYLEQRNLLRMYLMLGDPEHLDVEWATGRFTQLWADVAAQTADLSPLQLREAMRPHVRTYFELVKRKHVAPASLDASLVDRVRGALSSVPVDKRLYDFVVRSVEDLRVDEAGEPSIENQVFPPIMLPRVLAPDAQKFYLSKSNEAKQGYTLVSGAFTNRGQYGVFRQLEIAPAMLAKEEWVVPSGISEGEMVKLLTQVKNRYEEEFIQAWVAFFEDLRVKKPVNAEEAIELFRVVSTSEYPMRRLLQVLEDHTQWKNANPFEGNDAVLREANRRLENHINRYTQGVQVHVDLSSLVARMDRVPAAFLSATKFALTGPPPPGSSAVSTDSGVYTYAEEVKKLKNALIERKGRDPNLDVRSMSAEFEQTRAFAKNLLAKHDAMAVRLIEPLLTSPLEIGARPTLGQGVDPTKVDAPPPAGNKWQNPQNWKVTNPTPFDPLRPRP